MSDAKAPAAPPRAPITAGKAAGGLAACAASALAMAVAGIKPDEGLALTDYRDIANVPTACYGHTGADVHVGQHRTPAGCLVLLNKDVQREQSAVAACVPALRSRPYQWAASTRMAHNTGVSAFCHSGVARAFNTDQWRRGCDTMLLWDKAVVKGVKVVVPGLLARRQRERAQCLAEIVSSKRGTN